MKSQYLLFLLFSLCTINTSYSQEYFVYADSLGNIINEKSFKKQIKNYPTWRYITQDSILVKQIINAPVWETKFSTYSIAKKQIENSTNSEHPESTIFLISYILYNDYCNFSENQNIWNKERVEEFHYRLLPQVKTAERKNKNLKVIFLFQEELSLAKSKQRKKIFYKDINNNFKDSFLKNPATCGHMTLVKPNGEMLIYNGEYPIEWMAKKIKEKEWEEFFPENGKF